MTYRRWIGFLWVVLLLLPGACALLNRDPNSHFSTEQLRQMGERFLAARDFGQAIKYLTLAEEREPRDPVIHYDLGLAYDERGMSRNAVAHFEQALILKPDFADVQNALGSLYAKRGQLDKAENYFKKAVSNPFYETPFLGYFNLGLLYEKKGDTTAALAQYREAVRLQPAYGLAYYRMGQVLEGLKRGDEAREAYRQVIQSYPDMVDAHFRYGVMSYTAGELEAALYSLNRVVKLAPSSTMASEARKYLERMQGVIGLEHARPSSMSSAQRLSNLEVISEQDMANREQDVSSAKKTKSDLNKLSKLKPWDQSLLGSKDTSTPSPSESPVPSATPSPSPPGASTASGSPSAPAPASAAPSTSTTPSTYSTASAPAVRSASKSPAAAAAPSTSSSSSTTVPPQPQDAASPPLPPDTQWTYIVQVGSFLDKENADEVRQRLQAKGHDAILKPFHHQVLGQIFIVQLKPMSDQAKASRVMEEIEKVEPVKPIIIKVPAGY